MRRQVFKREKKKFGRSGAFNQGTKQSILQSRDEKAICETNAMRQVRGIQGARGHNLWRAGRAAKSSTNRTFFHGIYYRTVRNHYHARTAYAPSKISPAEYGAVAAARGYATLCLAQSAFCVVLHVVRLGSSELCLWGNKSNLSGNPLNFIVLSNISPDS